MINKLILTLLKYFLVLTKKYHNLVILYIKKLNIFFIIIKIVNFFSSTYKLNIINSSPRVIKRKPIIEEDVEISSIPPASNDATGRLPDAIIINAKDNQGQAKILTDVIFAYGEGVLIVSPYTGQATTGLLVISKIKLWI